jgi:hypothetical protein
LTLSFKRVYRDRREFQMKKARVPQRVNKITEENGWDGRERDAYHHFFASTLLGILTQLHIPCLMQ